MAKRKNKKKQKFNNWILISLVMLVVGILIGKFLIQDKISNSDDCNELRIDVTNQLRDYQDYSGCVVNEVYGLTSTSNAEFKIDACVLSSDINQYDDFEQYT
jgi:hypothetical protein